MKSSSETSGSNHKNAEELIANISKLMAEAEEMLSESTSHQGEGNVALLRASRERMEHRLASRYALAKEKLVHAAKWTDGAVRAYPYESVAIALGVGLVVGALCYRREE